MTLQALTANRLDDGEVVFWSGSNWALQFADAALFETPDDADAALDAAKPLTTLLVDPYLIEVSQDANGLPAPVSYRERIRALGPTDHLDLGKQVVGGAVVEAMQHAEGAARSTGRLSLIRRK